MENYVWWDIGEIIIKIKMLYLVFKFFNVNMLVLLLEKGFVKNFEYDFIFFYEILKCLKNLIGL